MKTARWVFGIAGVYGIIALVPLYFLEAFVGRVYPPAVTHPEFYYGFAGLGLMWQLAFLLIAKDPVRYRPIMLLGIGEKLAFVAAVAVLIAKGRPPGAVLPGAAIDLVLAVAFAVAWWNTGGAAADRLSRHS